jgi:hypothetical protein
MFTEETWEHSSKNGKEYKKSLHWLGQQCIILKSSILWSLKALQSHSYKLLVVQKCIPADPVVCMNSCPGCYNLPTIELSMQHFCSWAKKLGFIIAVLWMPTTTINGRPNNKLRAMAASFTRFEWNSLCAGKLEVKRHNPYNLETIQNESWSEIC